MDFIFEVVLLIAFVLAVLFIMARAKETNQQNQEAIRYNQELARQAQAKREAYEKQLNQIVELQREQIELQKQIYEELKISRNNGL